MSPEKIGLSHGFVHQASSPVTVNVSLWWWCYLEHKVHVFVRKIIILPFAKFRYHHRDSVCPEEVVMRLSIFKMGKHILVILYIFTVIYPGYFIRQSLSYLSWCYIQQQKIYAWWESNGLTLQSEGKLHRIHENHEYIRSSLRWRINGRDGVSNHQHHDCLLNSLFGRRSKQTSMFRITGLCAGNSPVNFPHKWPVTGKMFPFDDVIMWMKNVGRC